MANARTIVTEVLGNTSLDDRIEARLISGVHGVLEMTPSGYDPESVRKAKALIKATVELDGIRQMNESEALEKWAAEEAAKFFD